MRICKKISSRLPVAVILATGSHFVFAQMSTPGNFSVSAGGAANYVVPIVVPAGIGGVQPKLALTYSSQSPGGLAGVGWSLSGLSTITRCARTKEQDGVIGRISYDSNDRYCIDGQRLIAISGNDGADRTEYRTEQDVLTKVISYGSTGSAGQWGPQYFVIKTKSGLTMTYGATTDSAIEAQGKSAIRVWALNNISDTLGNNMNVAYTEDNANGEYLVDNVTYTGNSAAGVSPANVINFDYESRPDVSAIYQAGSIIKSTKRLTTVRMSTKTSTNGSSSLVESSELRLNYEINPSPATGRSRLSSIQQCDRPLSSSSSKCLPATRLTWSGAGITVSTVQGTLPWDFGLAGTYQLVTGDFNGDGLTDFIEVLNDSYYVFLAQATGGFSSNKYTFPNGWAFGNPVTATLVTGDFNGDGSTDFMEIVGSNYYMMQSDGTGVFAPPSGFPAGGGVLPNGLDLQAAVAVGSPGWVHVMPADVNGDGRTDFVAAVAFQDNASGITAGTKIYSYVSNGDGNFTGWVRDFTGDLRDDTASAVDQASYPASSYPIICPPQEVTIADFNGDGIPDLAVVSNDYWDNTANFVAILSGSGDGQFHIDHFGLSPLRVPPQIITNPSGPKYPMTIAKTSIDLNGDGLAEWGWLLWGGASQALINNGSAAPMAFQVLPQPAQVLKGQAATNPNAVLGAADVFSIQGDVNKDGVTDLIRLIAPTGSTGPVITLGASNRDGTFTTSSLPLPSGIDLSGNGRSSSSQIFSGDFDGDGRTDVMVLKGNAYYLISPSGDIPDLVTNIEPGVGLGARIDVTYSPVAQLGSAYERDLTAHYPKITVTPALTVVRKTDMRNGTDGVHTQFYKYGSALSEPSARGYLGFNWVEMSDAPSGLVSRTYYRQDWPYLGQVDRTAMYTSNGKWTRDAQGVATLSNPGSYYKQQINTYSCADVSNPTAAPLPDCTTAPGKRYFVYASKVVSWSQDLDGSAIGGTQTTQSVDGWGNPTSLTIDTLDGAGTTTGQRKTTTNIYANDTSNWYLGRLLRSTVQATAP